MTHAEMEKVQHRLNRLNLGWPWTWIAFARVWYRKLHKAPRKAIRRIEYRLTYGSWPRKRNHRKLLREGTDRIIKEGWMRI